MVCPYCQIWKFDTSIIPSKMVMFGGEDIFAVIIDMVMTEDLYGEPRVPNGFRIQGAYVLCHLQIKEHMQK